ncbi:MAG TPA: DUF4190 domain-containing protein [Holophaga sp.]|nr:DUF4190 domain-containing protein [Holophaga sp.]
MGFATWMSCFRSRAPLPRLGQPPFNLAPGSGPIKESDMNQFGAPSALKPHRGTMLIIFGVLGIICCVIFGILAWVMGQGDLKEMAAGQMDPSGEGMAKAAKILGIVSVVLNVIGILIWGLMMAGIFAAAAGGMG